MFFTVFCFPSKLSLHSPECLGTQTNQAGPELKEYGDLPASVFQVLEIKACAYIGFKLV